MEREGQHSEAPNRVITEIKIKSLNMRDFFVFQTYMQRKKQLH